MSLCPYGVLLPAGEAAGLERCPGYWGKGITPAAFALLLSVFG